MAVLVVTLPNQAGPLRGAEVVVVLVVELVVSVVLAAALFALVGALIVAPDVIVIVLVFPVVKAAICPNNPPPAPVLLARLCDGTVVVLLRGDGSCPFMEREKVKGRINSKQ